MPAPSPVEVSNLRGWSLLRHYHNNRALYVAQGRVLFKAAQAYIQKATPNNVANLNKNVIVSQDEIEIMLNSWLMHDPRWNGYLRGKAHLAPVLHVALTDIMSRHIAWDAYLDIIK